MLEGKLKAVQNSSHTKVSWELPALTTSTFDLVPVVHVYISDSVSPHITTQAVTLESEVSQLQASVVQYEGLVAEYKSQVPLQLETFPPPPPPPPPPPRIMQHFK